MTGDEAVTLRVLVQVESRFLGLAGVIGAVVLLAAAVASSGWVAPLVVLLGIGPVLAFCERVAYGSVLAGHVVWTDVHRYLGGAAGSGRRALESLLEVDGRAVVLEVERAAVGVVEMYRSLGFVETGRVGRRRDVELVELARPASPVSEGSVPGSVAPTDGEFVAGVAAGLVGFAVAGLDGLVTSVALVVLVLAALSDWRVQRISNGLLASGGVVVLAAAAEMGEWTGALGGAVIAAGPLLVMNLATAGRSPGMGDVKLAAFGGAAVGTGLGPVAGLVVVVGLFVGGVFGLVYESVMKRRGFPLGVPLAAVFAVAVLVEAVGQGSWL